MGNIDRFDKIVYYNAMGSKKVFVLLTLIAILAVSCGSKPDSVKGGNESDIGDTEIFDPRRISQAHYTSTRDEVQQFIENLNTIIRNRNYQAWRACLSQDYFEEISSQENLRRISAQPAMRSRQIVLRTAEDYFIHVVVPSRNNPEMPDLRVDDVEFISMNRVKAFTITRNRAGEEVRLLMYDLEKVGNSWIIIN